MVVVESIKTLYFIFLSTTVFDKIFKFCFLFQPNGTYLLFAANNEFAFAVMPSFLRIRSNSVYCIVNLTNLLMRLLENLNWLFNIKCVGGAQKPFTSYFKSNIKKSLSSLNIYSFHEVT